MASRPTSAAGNDAPARNDRDDGVHDAAGATDAAGDAPQRAGGGGRNARPPLAPKKKTGRVVKTKKPPTPLRRKLEEPDVDWDNALPNFGRCVAQELKQLTDTFVSQGEISFSAFKRCWTTQRMSTLYHVEFWESTPARVHQIVLHQALAFVLDSIERAEQAMGGRDAVARLLAAVFALYCAYSVQLGTPKHKIAVNPREWAQLMQLEASLMSNAKSEFPSAFEEALVMLDRLSTSDNAFLKCLQGPAPRLRLRRRLPLARLPTRENVAPLRQPEQEITYDNTLEMPVLDETLKLVDAAGSLYVQRLQEMQQPNQARARTGGRRDLTSPWFATRLEGVHKLSDALAGYVRQVTEWAQAQPNDSTDSTHLHGSFNVLTLADMSMRGSDHDHAMSVGASSEWGGGDHSDDDGLAELEAELQVDIDEKSRPHTVVRKPTDARRRTPSRPRPAVEQALSVASTSDSAMLAELEAELERTTVEPGVAPQQSPSARGRPTQPARRRARLSAGLFAPPMSETESDGLSVLQAELDAKISDLDAPTTSPVGQRQASPRIMTVADYSASSIADSDLAAFEAELAMDTESPAASNAGSKSSPTPTRRSSRLAKKADNTALVLTATREATDVQAVRKTRSRTSNRVSSSPVAAPDHIADANSVVSATMSDGGLAAPQAELNAVPSVAVSGIVPREPPISALIPVPAVPRRKRGPPAAASAAALEVMSIATSDGGLAELEAELRAMPGLDSTATTPRKRQQRSKGIKPTPASVTSHHHQPVDVMSIASSRDDELAALQAELDASPAPPRVKKGVTKAKPTRTRAPRKATAKKAVATPAKKVGRVTAKPRVTSRQRKASVETPATNAAPKARTRTRPTEAPEKPVTPVGTTLVSANADMPTTAAHANVGTSDTESDGLGDLEAELQTMPAIR